jgi:WD40 repeat protein
MASFNGNNAPEEINCNEHIFDIAFHPTTNCIAIGMIDGAVALYKYDINEPNQLLLTNNKHTSSCRGTLFNATGNKLYTISSDRSFQAIDSTGQSLFNIEKAHDSPINKFISLDGISDVGHDIIATGDDTGCVKLWDTRISSSPSSNIMEWNLHEDFVSGFAYNNDAQTLLSVGGDATLCAYDLRKKDNSARSDDQEAELHCVEVIKGGRKVICGTQEGVILLFSWGKWGDCTDRYPGHPETLDCMHKVDEGTIMTGSSDGLIRVVGLQPNKILGVLGDHEEFPIEGMESSHCGRILGSFSHDETVRFWDISIFADDEDDGNGDDMGVDDDEEDGSSSKCLDQTGEESEEGCEEDDNRWEDEDMSASSDGKHLLLFYSRYSLNSIKYFIFIIYYYCNVY